MRILDAIDPPLWLITSGDLEEPAGLIATFVCVASIVPTRPRLLLGLGKEHHTTLRAHQSGAVGCHLLDERHVPWVFRFAGRHGHDGHAREKFAGLVVQAGTTGAPLLPESLCSAEGTVLDTFHTKDRDLVLVGLTGELPNQEGTGRPLTWSRYAALAPAEEVARLQELLAEDIERDLKLMSL